MFENRLQQFCPNLMCRSCHVLLTFNFHLSEILGVLNGGLCFLFPCHCFLLILERSLSYYEKKQNTLKLLFLPITSVTMAEQNTDQRRSNTICYKLRIPARDHSVFSCSPCIKLYQSSEYFLQVAFCLSGKVSSNLQIKRTKNIMKRIIDNTHITTPQTPTPLLKKTLKSMVNVYLRNCRNPYICKSK